MTRKFYRRMLSSLIVTLTVIVFSLNATAQTKLTLVTDQWPPFYGPTIEQGGFLVALTQRVFSNAGYEVEIKFMPWNRAVEGAKRGIYDGLLGAYYTAERAKRYVYSSALAQEHTVLVARTALNVKYREIEDLRGYKIGVRRGAIHSEAFDSATYLDRQYSNSADQNIRKLFFDRLDMIVTGQTQFNAIIDQSYNQWRSYVTVLSPPLKVNQIYLTIGRQRGDHKTLINAFNDALTAFKRSGEFAALQREFGLSFPIPEELSPVSK
ncbi:MAG: substrate-binding periplasmic protein [Pseudomonadales bacterium]